MKTNNDVDEEETEEQVKVVPQSNIAQSYLCPICGNQVKFSSVSVFKSRSKYSFDCVYILCLRSVCQSHHHYYLSDKFVQK
jgi:hypothetical protein